MELAPQSLFQPCIFYVQTFRGFPFEANSRQKPTKELMIIYFQGVQQNFEKKNGQ
jgi:hypothetical protein